MLSENGHRQAARKDAYALNRLFEVNDHASIIAMGVPNGILEG
jgi:hypothetical protein